MEASWDIRLSDMRWICLSLSWNLPHTLGSSSRAKNLLSYLLPVLGTGYPQTSAKYIFITVYSRTSQDAYAVDENDIIHFDPEGRITISKRPSEPGGVKDLVFKNLPSKKLWRLVGTWYLMPDVSCLCQYCMFNLECLIGSHSPHAQWTFAIS